MAESRGKNKNLVEAGNPRLLKKLVKNGTEYSLYLEYQMGYNRDNGTSIRKKESLSLYLLASPRTPIQRQQNKETLELAKKIRFEREQEFLDNREGYRLKKEKVLELVAVLSSALLGVSPTLSLSILVWLLLYLFLPRTCPINKHHRRVKFKENIFC